MRRNDRTFVLKSQGSLDTRGAVSYNSGRIVPVAQGIEQEPSKFKVGGSNPSRDAAKNARMLRGHLHFKRQTVADELVP